MEYRLVHCNVSFQPSTRGGDGRLCCASQSRRSTNSWMSLCLPGDGRGVCHALCHARAEQCGGLDPVTSNSAHCVEANTASASMTDGARRLQSYCTNASMTPLASEWWHFNDLDAQNKVRMTSGNGKFWLDGCVSWKMFELADLLGHVAHALGAWPGGAAPRPPRWPPEPAGSKESARSPPPAGRRRGCRYLEAWTTESNITRVFALRCCSGRA